MCLTARDAVTHPGPHRCRALQLLRYVLRIHEWLDRNGQPPGVIIPIVVYHGEHVWDEPTSLRDKVQAEDDLLDFVPDMRVILVDLNLLKSAFLPDFPELEARVRALQISRSPELPFEALVDLFKLLQNWGKIHSQQDTLNDIMIYLCSVFDAPNLEQLELAFHTGQLPGSEKQMPNCLEALFARGVEQGLEEGLERGLLAGRIRALQQVLNQPTMTPRELASKSLTELQAQAAELASLLNLDPQ
ncbi:MAG: Rpn family recombination-promoting nuclease/putative transposase [Planctomyces sp.]